MKRGPDERLSIVIRGAGTKIDWGRPAARIDVVLDMRRLNRVLAHAHGDLTATVEAGATLARRERRACRARTVAAARSAVRGRGDDRRHPRDQRQRPAAPPVRHAARSDHRHPARDDRRRLAKAGGQVVKNVAGYDLSKLVCGSFGSLAAIVSATFKLVADSEASKTMRGRGGGSTPRSRRRSDASMASQLEPIAFEVHVRQRSSTRTRSARNVIGELGGSAAEVVLRFASLPSRSTRRSPRRPMR